jgi:tetratricopeptide (TPR) repeat protein
MPYSVLELANAFLLAGELPDARQVLADYFANPPTLNAQDHEQAVRMWVDILGHGDEADQRLASSEYDRLAVLLPTDHIKRAMIHYRLGELSLARGLLQLAMMAYPQDDRLCESLLFIYHKTGDAQAALSLIKALPKKWVWSRWAGDFAMMAGDFVLAVASYTDAIMALEARYGLSDDTPATILSSAKMTDAEGLAIVGVYAEILLARAEAYRQNNQPHEATQDEARAKRLIPHDPTL